MYNKMKQLYKTNFGLRTEEVPLPTPGDKEILVKVHYSLISTGTETGGMQKRAQYSLSDKISEKKEQLDKVLNKLRAEGLAPTLEKIRKKVTPKEADLIFRPIGYSNSGIVVAIGSLITGFNVGDRVACAGSGIAAHAEYVTVPVNLAVKIPDHLASDKAAFTTVASIALQGIRRANCQPGETIVIVGLGLIGLIAVQIAKTYGYKVIGTDIIDSKVEIAKKLGADSSFLPSSDLKEKVYALTDGHGADAAIIYASSDGSGIVNEAISYCRQKGRVVIVGAVGMEIERDEMYRKELDLVMSTSYGPGRYDSDYEYKGVDYPFAYVRWTENRNMQEIIRLLADNKIDVTPLVNGTFSIEEAESAFKSLTDKEKNYICVLFRYTHEEKLITDKKFIINTSFKPTRKINVALIGAGGFAKRTHLPNLNKLDDIYTIRAIADKNPITAKSVGKEFKVEYVTTDYKELLNDDKVDMIIISTRHDLHAEIVIEALKKNKHVLVEKPLAINQAELEKIKEVLADTKSIIRVGFNRRYSPFIQKMKEIIQYEGGPIFINYRINAGYIPPDHWTQDYSIGGGRLVGEFCHFIDLVNYLNTSELTGMDVAHIPVDEKSIFSDDNVCVNLNYENGSIAQISYISIGGKDLPKERMEVFINKKSIIINDFTEFLMYNTGMQNVKLRSADKGHLKELEIFGQLIKGNTSISPDFNFDLKSTELTFKILEEIRGENQKLSLSK
jgi:predicted dehydrogenase/threonine dehydrogenase-like Zn-dependent dehydrogenase